MKKKTVIGITGGLASGKTLVADLFEKMGAHKIDADKISHELLSDEGIKNEIVELLGNRILSNGEIDRRKVSAIVFFDEKSLKGLCRILHPAILKRIKTETERSAKEVVVVDAPLLFEEDLQEDVDQVIVVTATREKQIERAVRRGITEEEAVKIIKNQLSIEEKIRRADHVIDSDEDIESIKKGVVEIWQKM